MLYKLTTIDTWINTSEISHIVHTKNSIVHKMEIHMNNGESVVINMTSSDECRQITSDLFSAMGQKYEYKG